MSLFNLFRKSEWSKLKRFHPNALNDVSRLVAFDSLIKAAISSSIGREFGNAEKWSCDSWKELSKALSANKLFGELHLAILSTGNGKTFESINWSCVPSHRPISFLGALAMCEFRTDEHLNSMNDLKYSGYSVHPDEARSQFLVVLADHADVNDLDEVKDFDDEVFIDFWNKLRKTVFLDLQLNVNTETPGLSAITKERFDRLSKSRQEAVLIFADVLSKKSGSQEPPPEIKKEPPPFNPQQHKLEHPFLYVPYTKLVRLMDKLAPDIRHFFHKLSIDEYELRRIVEAKDFVSIDAILDLVVFDCEILAYSLVVAIVENHEPNFAGCGVWKKVTEIFENRNSKRRINAASMQANGMLGDATARDAVDVEKAVALSLDLLMEIRRASTEFNKSSGDYGVLLKGTTVLKHVFNHPRYREPFSEYMIDVFSTIEPVLKDFTQGELLAWKEQENLKVDD